MVSQESVSSPQHKVNADADFSRIHAKFHSATTHGEYATIDPTLRKTSYLSVPVTYSNAFNTSCACLPNGSRPACCAAARSSSKAVLTRG